jgi:hypothetical protein
MVEPKGVAQPRRPEGAERLPPLTAQSGKKKGVAQQRRPEGAERLPDSLRRRRIRAPARIWWTKLV